MNGMRNGVLAITRDARLALINDEAYRISGVTAQPEDVGQPVANVLRDHPDVVRCIAGAFRSCTTSRTGRDAAEAVEQGDRLHAWRSCGLTTAR